jgi:hypothetical protein
MSIDPAKLYKYLVSEREKRPNFLGAFFGFIIMID